MINLKNIVKVLLLALFICAYSGDLYAQEGQNWSFGSSNSSFYTPEAKETPKCPEGTTWSAPDNSCRDASGKNKGYLGGKSGAEISAEASAKSVATTNGEQTAQDPTFCGSDYGIFNELVQTGQKIFKRLRDLIYVVAGFGIIAVAVGGFFGNLNWKWLGAIVISLVVVATAGELVVLMTGCEQFGSSLVTNTLTTPTTSMTTEQYNEMYTEKTESAGKIAWDDYFDEGYGYGQSSSTTELQNGVTFEEGVQSE